MTAGMASDRSPHRKAFLKDIEVMKCRIPLTDTLSVVSRIQLISRMANVVNDSIVMWIYIF